MNILSIGSGFFAKKHAEIFAAMDDVNVCGFTSRSIANARSAADGFARTTGSTVPAFNDLSAAIQETAPDAALISVTPDGHGPIEHTLINNGIPFLVEKPIGIDEATVDAIGEALEKKGLVASVGFHMRYSDIVDLLQTRLETVTPVLASGYWMGTLPPPAWWHHMGESGGQFNEQTVHITDLIRYLLGEVESVAAATSATAIRSLHADADVPDAGAAVLRMQSGITATIINSCVGPASTRVGLEIVSPDALFSYTQPRLVETRDGTTVATEGRADPYVLEDTVFVEAVRSGDAGSVRSPYADAIKTHRVSAAIARAASTGSTVTL